MSDFNENMDYGTEMSTDEGLSKEDLAGAGLIGLAMVVGIGAYEGGKKGIHKFGEFLDKKGKNPITNMKAKKKAKLQEQLDEGILNSPEVQAAIKKKEAEVQAAAEAVMATEK